MTFRNHVLRAVTALLPTRTPVSYPVPRGPITSLKPLVPDTGTPPAPSHPDLALVMQHWHLHQKNFPGESWSEFIRSLEMRHAFFADERRERVTKLNRLIARTRPRI